MVLLRMNKSVLLVGLLSESERVSTFSNKLSSYPKCGPIVWQLLACLIDWLVCLFVCLLVCFIDIFLRANFN